MTVNITTDPIADMLSRIRNAISVRKAEVYVPYSKLKEAVAKQLKSSAFVYDVDVEGSGVDKMIKVTINSDSANARITEIKRISSPGRRVYSSADKIPTIKRGRGIVIISTSKGIMTGSEAKAKLLGGELICSVY